VAAGTGGDGVGGSNGDGVWPVQENLAPSLQQGLSRCMHRRGFFIRRRYSSTASRTKTNAVIITIVMICFMFMWGRLGVNRRWVRYLTAVVSMGSAIAGVVVFLGVAENYWGNPVFVWAVSIFGLILGLVYLIKGRIFLWMQWPD